MTKILISTKLPNPIRETRVSKLVFISIPCIKFLAKCTNMCTTQLLLDKYYGTFLYSTVRILWILEGMGNFL